MILKKKTGVFHQRSMLLFLCTNIILSKLYLTLSLLSWDKMQKCQCVVTSAVKRCNELLLLFLVFIVLKHFKMFGLLVFLGFSLSKLVNICFYWILLGIYLLFLLLILRVLCKSKYTHWTPNDEITACSMILLPFEKEMILVIFFNLLIPLI